MKIWAYYIIGVTVESQSQKVVGLLGYGRGVAGLQEPTRRRCSRPYKTYLGMDSLADWAGPEGTKICRERSVFRLGRAAARLPERVLCCISRLYI